MSIQLTTDTHIDISQTHTMNYDEAERFAKELLEHIEEIKEFEKDEKERIPENQQDSYHVTVKLYAGTWGFGYLTQHNYGWDRKVN